VLGIRNDIVMDCKLLITYHKTLAKSKNRRIQKSSNFHIKIGALEILLVPPRGVEPLDYLFSELGSIYLEIKSGMKELKNLRCLKQKSNLSPAYLD